MGNGYIHIGTAGNILNERMLIIPAQHYFSRKFDIGGDWTELRVQFVVSWTDTTGYEVKPSNIASYDASSFYNRLYLGLINGDIGEVFPGDSGQYFAGMCTKGSSETFSFNTTSNGTYHYDFSVNIIENGSETWNPMGANSIFLTCSTLGYYYHPIRYVRDTVNETLKVEWHYKTSAHYAATQPTESAMEADMDTFGGSTLYTATFDWANTNPVLNSIFIYQPHASCRMRVHGFLVKKYS